MTLRTCLFAALSLAAISPRAHADDTEVDVRSFEYVDVIETADGSIWKGVVVEQTPNVQYKIATADGSLHVIRSADVVKLTKQRNKDYHPTVAAADSTGHATSTSVRPDGVTGSYEAHTGGGLPAPLATSGLRIDPEFALVFPTGDIQKTNTSYTPGVRVGYEALFGNFGIGGGALARYTYWQLPGMTNDAASTIETHLYGRAALHISRVTIYGGVSLGLDMNYVYLSQVDMSKTTVGFGMNIQSGVEVLATPAFAVKLGFDYHPGTDQIMDGIPGSVSYFALLFGGSLRL